MSPVDPAPEQVTGNISQEQNRPGEPPAHPLGPPDQSVSQSLSHGLRNRCFGCGEDNPQGLHLVFAVEPDGTVQAEAVIGSNYEGPPGHLHGGIIATLLDETMSKANRARGEIAVTRQLQVEYLHPIPSTAPIRLRGHVEKQDGRKLWTRASILNAAGKELATGSGFFLSVMKAP